MLFWKQRLRHADIEREKYWAAAIAAQDKHDNPKVVAKLWKKYRRYDKWLYNFYRNQWLRHVKTELKEWHPYGAFANLPQLFMDMVDYCWEYWHMGYNVHAEASYANPILEQTSHAKQLADECRCEQAKSGDDYPTEKLVELFTYVAQNVNNWDD